MTRIAGWPALLLLASVSCGAQDWFFDSDAALDAADDETPPALDASEDGGRVPIDAAVDGANSETGSDASSRPDALQSCFADPDCPPDEPLCLRPPGVCVRCLDDDDCVNAPGGPACDSSSGRCVECTANSQCPNSSPRCDPAALSCVQCLSNSDCGRESQCNLATHACSPMF